MCWISDWRVRGAWVGAAQTSSMWRRARICDGRQGRRNSRQPEGCACSRCRVRRAARARRLLPAPRRGTSGRGGGNPEPASQTSRVSDQRSPGTSRPAPCTSTTDPGQWAKPYLMREPAIVGRVLPRTRTRTPPHRERPDASAAGGARRAPHAPRGVCAVRMTTLRRFVDRFGASGVGERPPLYAARSVGCGRRQFPTPRPI